MERAEDCENVISRDAQDTVGEEDKSPRDAQNGAQSEDDHNAFAISVDILAARIGFLVTGEHGQYDDEGGKSEQEDQRIAAYVHDPVDGIVCYPAPTNTLGIK